jgi:hypothetical protein
VKHWIPKERQTLKLIRNYHEGYGRTLVRIQCDVLAAKIFGKPRWLIRKVIELKIVYFFQRIFKGPEVWVKGLTEVSTYRGMLKEYR